MIAESRLPLALEPIRRGLLWRRLLRGAVLGTAGGGVIAALLVIVVGSPLTLLVMAVGLVAGMIVSLRRRPRHLDAARLMDRHYGLQDRVTTALELVARGDLMAVLQRSQAEMVVQDLPGGRLVRVRPENRELAGLGVSVVLVLGALAWAARPAPATATSSLSPASRAAALAQLRVLQRSVAAAEQSGGRGLQVLHQEQRILSHLGQTIQRADSEAAALRAISRAQQQLQSAAAAATPRDLSDAKTISGQVHGALPGLNSSTLGKTPQQVAGQLLNQLATRLTSVPAAQQAALAKKLESAANGVTDKRIRRLLRQAANALARHNAQRAGTTIKRAGALMNAARGAPKARAQVYRSSRALDSIKGKVAGIPTSHAKKSASGIRGKGQGGGSGASGASGSGGSSGPTGQSNASGTRTSGTAKGRSFASKVKGGSAPGSGSGIPGGTHNRTASRGQTVYVANPKAGVSIIQSRGESAPPQAMRPVPYQRVLARYSQAARAALDQKTIPPSLRTFVRRYFVELARS